MITVTAEFLRDRHPLPDHAGGGSKEARGRVRRVASHVQTKP